VMSPWVTVVSAVPRKKFAKGEELGVLSLPSPRFTLATLGVSPMRGVTPPYNGDNPLAIVAADNEADPPFEGSLP